MNKRKKIVYFGLVTSIAILLCLQVGAINIVKTNDDHFYKNPLISQEIERVSFEVEKLGQSMRTASLAGNALVSFESPDDDEWPAITKDHNGNIVVTWTNQVSILETKIGFGYSQDGEIWDAMLYALEGMPMYSDVAYVHGIDFDGGGDFVGLWGVYGDVLENQASFYRMADITDDTTHEFYSWTTEYTDTVDCCISDNTWYNEFNYDVTGPTSMYLYREIYDVYDIPQCPTHWYTDGNNEEGGVGYFDGQSELVTAPARDCDMACLHDANPAQTNDDFVLLTWQYDNQSTGKSQIVFKKIVPEMEPDIEYTPYQFYIGLGSHPNIGAAGDKAVIVYMAEDGNVISAYSTDRGDTWTTSTIGPGKFPAVYMNGNNAYCAYTNNGDLYLAESTDGGATWENLRQINDVDGTVVEGENTVDIHPAGIVWTDTRNGDMDIYFASAVAAPVITVKSISGGFGVSAEIENVGTADATNVQWSIDLEGGLVIIGKHADGTISTLAVGATQTVKIGFVLGIGGVTITAAADGASKTASGTVLGPLVIGVS